jgi:hypothetical protein
MISPVAERLRFRLTAKDVCFAAGTGCLVAAFLLLLWRGPMPFEDLLRRFALMDSGGSLHLASQPTLLRHYYRQALALGLGLIGVTTLLALAWSRLNGFTQAKLWRATCTLACTCALCLYIFKITHDSSWSPVDVLVTNPGTLPIFGHRLLFVWLGQAFQTAVPTLSPLRCYYASQMITALLAIYAVGRWSAIHVGEALSPLGQVLAVILISTCLDYRNFYDIGIVFFFSCGLLALYRRKYVWFVVVATVGTLNHENVLLLVPTAAFLLYDTEPRRVWLAVVAASLAGHLLARAAMQYLIPFQGHVDWRIWSNMTKPFLYHREMAFSLLALGGWYALGLMSLPACDKRLRRLLLLFPMLCGVTFLFGQFHEPRQFNAFIPVLIAVLLKGSQWSVKQSPA